MEVDEIKIAINNCKCDECTLRKACDLYELATDETICGAITDRVEEF